MKHGRFGLFLLQLRDYKFKNANEDCVERVTDPNLVFEQF